MSEVTRRGFLRTTSVGAAAFGILSSLPTLVFAEGEDQAPQSATGLPSVLPQAAGPSATASGGTTATPFVVYVADASAGQAVIYVGEQEIPLTDPSIVRALQQAAVSA